MSRIVLNRMVFICNSQFSNESTVALRQFVPSQAVVRGCIHPCHPSVVLALLICIDGVYSSVFIAGVRNRLGAGLVLISVQNVGCSEML